MKHTFTADLCPHGVTRAELAGILGDRLGAFDHWMRGQTVSICEGRRWDHDKKEYQPTACADSPHGVVVYRWDLQRFLDGGPIVD